MAFRTGDPLADFDHYDQAQADYEASLPKCEECGMPIQDDYLFNVYGEILCEDCAKAKFRRSAEDYIDQ